MKKVLALFVTLTMVLVFCVGCGGSSAGILKATLSLSVYSSLHQETTEPAESRRLLAFSMQTRFSLQ